MKKLKNKLITFFLGLSLSLAPSFYSNLHAQQKPITKKEQAKILFKKGMEFEKNGDLGAALFYYLKTRSTGQVKTIIDTKIREVIPKVKDSLNENNYDLAVVDFRNSTQDYGLPGLISSYLINNILNKENKITIKGRMNLEEATEKADVILTGDINYFNITEQQNVDSETIIYKSGTVQVANKRYSELQIEVQRNYDECLSAARRADAIYDEEARRLQQIGDGGFDSLLGGLIRKDKGAALRGFINMGRESMGQNSLAQLKDRLVSEVNTICQAYFNSKAKMEITPSTLTETLHSQHTKMITTYLIEGVLKLNLSLIDKNKVSFFEKSVEKSMRDRDQTYPTFWPANIKGDPLEIMSSMEMKEALIKKALEELTYSLSNSISSYVPTHLLNQARKAKSLKDSNNTIDYYIKYLIVGNDPVCKKEAVDYLNLKGLKISGGALELILR